MHMFIPYEFLVDAPLQRSFLAFYYLNLLSLFILLPRLSLSSRGVMLVVSLHAVGAQNGVLILDLQTHVPGPLVRYVSFQFQDKYLTSAQVLAIVVVIPSVLAFLRSFKYRWRTDTTNNLHRPGPRPSTENGQPPSVPLIHHARDQQRSGLPN